MGTQDPEPKALVPKTQDAELRTQDPRPQEPQSRI